MAQSECLRKIIIPEKDFPYTCTAAAAVDQEFLFRPRVTTSCELLRRVQATPQDER